MIGQHDELQPRAPGRSGHVFHRAGSVGPDGVHVQAATDSQRIGDNAGHDQCAAWEERPRHEHDRGTSQQTA